MRTTFSEEIARIQDAYRSFLAVRRHDGESYFACVDIKHRSTRCTLGINGLPLRNGQKCPALTDGGKEILHIEFVHQSPSSSGEA
jgi:hypothetical protein